MFGFPLDEERELSDIEGFAEGNDFPDALPDEVATRHVETRFDQVINVLEPGWKEVNTDHHTLCQYNYLLPFLSLHVTV